MSVGAIIASAAVGAAGDNIGKQAGQNITKLGGTGLQATIRAIQNKWAGGAGRTIVSASKDLQVEPIVLLDERVARYPYVSDLLQAAQRLYTSHYLLSVAADNRIGNVSIAGRISKFSTDPDLLKATANFLTPSQLAGGQYSSEAYEFGLPFGDEPIGLDKYAAYSVESVHPHYSAEAADSNLMKQAMDIHSLSMGQIVDITVSDETGSKHAKVPIMVKLRVIGISPENMVNNFEYGLLENNTKVKKLQVKVNQLSLKDAITNQQEIDAYRRARFSDKSGYFKAARDRANKGVLATFLTGEPHVGTVSSIAIADSRTIREVETETYRNINDYSTRQKLFEKTLLVLLFVVDDAAATVTLYVRDTDGHKTYPLDDLKKTNKSNDLSDLLKSFLNGQIPGRL